jgi:hypothetical protein
LAAAAFSDVPGAPKKGRWFPAVTFDGVPATTFSVASDSQLTAQVPDGASTGPIAVTTPLGTGTSPTDLIVKPKVQSFSPPSGPVGTVVTIKGTAFTGATKVMFTGHKGKILTVAYGRSRCACCSAR